MLNYSVSMPEDGDERDFILSVYEQYKYVMLNTAEKLEPDADAAGDLLQEVLLRLIEKASELMELDSRVLVAYIVHTIRNTATDRFRRRQVREKHIDPRALTEETEASFRQGAERSLEDEVLRSMRSAELRSILRRLPDRTQLLLRGKYQLSLDDAELARLLGCRPDSIRMMLTRARRQALELLEKEGFDEIT